MTELEQLLDKARQLAEARNHKLLPFVRHGRSTGSRCVTCARHQGQRSRAGAVEIGWSELRQNILRFAIYSFQL